MSYTINIPSKKTTFNTDESSLQGAMSALVNLWYDGTIELKEIPIFMRPETLHNVKIDFSNSQSLSNEIRESLYNNMLLVITDSLAWCKMFKDFLEKSTVPIYLTIL